MSRRPPRSTQTDTLCPYQTLFRSEGYCLSRGWEVAAEFVEPGNTATDDRRPAFQAMIDAAMQKPPAFSVILVHSFSRFFRDQFQFERSEEHTSELKSLMRISYAVICLKKTTTNRQKTQLKKH